MTAFKQYDDSSNVLLYSLVFVAYFGLCASFNPELSAATRWSPAGATWYGSPNGAGSDGGSCGYETLVSQPPFSSMVTATGPFLYMEGKECGACYQVKCTTHPACSGEPVRVVVTDSCPGCTSESPHFDLSGYAFGAMAIPGQEQSLRDVGVLQVQYARDACDYRGKTIEFHIDTGSNPYYFAVVVEFVEGGGDLATVELKQAGISEWRAMQQSWGAVWKLDAGGRLNPPFSIRLTARDSGKTLVAENAIPGGWRPGATYRSVVNFKA